MLTSPLGIISSAASSYNRTVREPDEKIVDLLPLLPGVERLQVQVTSPDTVTFTLQKQDVVGCAGQYLERAFNSEGAVGAPAGPPSPSGSESLFDYVMRLPSKNVYLKMEKEISEEKAAQLLGVARGLNPAEVVVVAEKGVRMDEWLDPVFISENKVMRGRFRTLHTAELLSAFFGERFASTFEFEGEAVRATLVLMKRTEP